MTIKIKNLHAKVDEKEILKGISLDIKAGEIHAIMGPNGSGKSTLSHVLTGRDGYEVTGGSVDFDGKNLLDLKIDERAREGLFLAFQYPVEIPGVVSMSFLKSAINIHRKHKNLPELDAGAILKLVREKARIVGINDAMLKRAVNSGFSGGEKKRFDILQMLLLEPSFSILDEIDSGLDVDALQAVAAAVNSMRSAERSMLIITHYQRLLDYIKPDFVHVLSGGRIIASGDSNLAKEIEKNGYAMFAEAA
jgi:Fe-S cluster assembly ATP-binding protein